MPTRGHIARASAVAALLAVAAGCGDPGLRASDASIAGMFQRDEVRLMRLIDMGYEDHAQVLWLMTHENEPCETILPEERWKVYDRIAEHTGVRSVHFTEGRAELSLVFSSNEFMKDGLVKGLLYTSQPVQPLLASLDAGLPDDVLKSGAHTAYRRLAPNWYLFVRQE